MIGIYKITNQVNGKVYIGQSVNIEKRWKEHRSRAFNSADADYNKYLYRAIRKYGIENFSFEVIEQCNQIQLNEKEKEYIAKYNSTNRNYGYNICLGGEGTQRYNYEEIYNKWKEGYTCYELQKFYNCTDKVITQALRAYGIPESSAKSRSIKDKNAIVFIDIKTNTPLKIFYGAKSVCRFFDLPETRADNLLNALYHNYTFWGFKVELLSDNNYPKKNYSKEEILSFQQQPKYIYTEEEKLDMSLSRRKVERPSREKLKELIRTQPFTYIAQQYEVSDNAIRKWCDFEKLPRKKSEINKYTDEEWAQI